MLLILGVCAIGLFVGTILACLALCHIKNANVFSLCNEYLNSDYVDEVLTAQITINPKNDFDYVYDAGNLPYGRVSAFLNHFGRNIYDEEPYAFYCNRSSRDNEFREYGSILARTGVYISKENPQNKELKEKDSTVLEGKNSFIDFSGLVFVSSLGKKIVTVHHCPKAILDRPGIYTIENDLLRKQIVTLCNTVINGKIGIYLQKGLVIDGVETEPYQSNGDYDNSYEHSDSPSALGDETNPDAENIGLVAAGVQAVKPKMAAFFGEVKNLMNGSRGHGYAAEYANNTMDRVMGKDVESAAQQLDERGKQVKNGADRLVNGVEIQTKYYKTASETIGAAFEHNEAKYIRSDGTGKMMQIEVPRDQYRDALEAMQKRIDKGEVPNVSPGESAKNYVRKGFFTYEQSFNIARAGTVESLAVDAISGAVCCAAVAGISSVIVFALALWKGKTPKEAAGQCLMTSLAVMGKGTLIYMLTMQLSRKEIAVAFAGKAFTADGISQGYKAISNPVHEISENLANKISQSGLAASGIGKRIGLDTIGGRRLIGGTITFAVVFGPDVVRTMQGKISTKQLFKNSAIAAASMTGAAAAQAAVPIPVLPAIVGGAVAGIVAKKTLDHFIEDDAKEMFRILKEEFIDMTMLVGLSESEFDEVTQMTIRNKKLPKMLQKMYQSEDRRSYARIEIMQVAIIGIMEKRDSISQKEYEQGILEYATDIA